MMTGLWAQKMKVETLVYYKAENLVMQILGNDKVTFGGSSYLKVTVQLL